MEKKLSEQFQKSQYNHKEESDGIKYNSRLIRQNRKLLAFISVFSLFLFIYLLIAFYESATCLLINKQLLSMLLSLCITVSNGILLICELKYHDLTIETRRFMNIFSQCTFLSCFILLRLISDEDLIVNLKLDYISIISYILFHCYNYITQVMAFSNIFRLSLLQCLYYSMIYLIKHILQGKHWNYIFYYYTIFIGGNLVGYYQYQYQKMKIYYEDQIEHRIRMEKERMNESKSGVMIIENELFCYCNKKSIEYIRNYLSMKSYNNDDDVLFELNRNPNEFIRKLLINPMTTTINNNIDNRTIFQELKAKYLASQQNQSKTHKPFISLGLQSYNAFKLEILYAYNIIGNTEQLQLILNEPSTSKSLLNYTKCDIFNHQTLFLSKIVHELKNPLITINELTNLLSHKLKHNNTQAIDHDISLMKSLSSYMLSIAKDMECFSELQLENKLSLILGNCSINDNVLLVKDITEGLLIRYNKTNKIQFNVSIDQALPKMIFTDEIRLRQVIINLISNAVKFTHEGVISLIFTKEDDSIKIAVCDSGIGLSEDKKQSLFCPFEKELVNNPYGAGLGMCIIKELTSHLGSSIEFTSQEGLGSSFWFKIHLAKEGLEKQSFITKLNHSHSPYRLVERSTMDISMSSDSFTDYDNDGESDNDNDNQKKNCFSKTINLSNITFNLNHSNVLQEINNEKKKKTMHILIADDEPFVRKATIRILTKYGEKHKISITISEAGDGNEILDYLTKSISSNSNTNSNSNQKRVDMILCDEEMPNCSGHECYNHLQQLQKEHKITHIPFIIMTGNTDITSNALIISKPLSLNKVDNLLQLCT